MMRIIGIMEDYGGLWRIMGDYGGCKLSPMAIGGRFSRGTLFNSDFNSHNSVVKESRE